MKPLRYHPALVVLHWLLALMIIFSLVVGTSMSEIKNTSPDKIFALRGHMTTGILILVLMIIRVVVRFRSTLPERATTGNAFLDKIGVIIHYGLYILVFLMLISGIETAINADLPSIVFGDSGEPLPEDFDEIGSKIVHGVISKLLLLLIFVHFLAALYHQFINKDNLFARMWFGRR